MANTVFYSWQSDCPNLTNRTFIEEALIKAIKEVSSDIEVLNADRDNPLELDKDTQGVPGIPPIVDVIFQKISGAAVFVPDLTFVGKSEKPRLIPNPNVLIEYGWALRALGHSRIVPIMNTAYGEITEENLPFNMRHLRRPFTYELSPQANPEERQRVKSKLVKHLVSAIGLILKAHSPETEQSEVGHIAITSTEDPSTFLKKGEPLGFIGGGFRPEQGIMVPDNEHLFLRMLPLKTVQPIASSQKALALLISGKIRPFTAEVGGWNQDRNKYGAFAVAHYNEMVFGLTQVFRNRELWGIDTITIDKKECMDRINVDFGYFPYSLLEESFILTLSSYLPFCRDSLQLSLPLKFIAGTTRVRNYRIPAPNGMGFRGKVVDDHIIYEGIITDFDSDPKLLLRPFFEKLWEECGLIRPDREQL